MLPHAYNIAIDRGVGAPVHGKYVVYDLNASEKRFISMLIYKCATSWCSHKQHIYDHA